MRDSVPFQKTIAVGPDAIDENGHVNNVVFVQWMQEVAYAHSRSLGFDTARLSALGATWFVRSHAIHYRRPAQLSDQIVARTWVDSMKRASSLRKYAFHRASDQQLLAEGETDWVYVDRQTGRPRPIDPSIRAALFP